MRRRFSGIALLATASAIGALGASTLSAGVAAAAPAEGSVRGTGAAGVLKDRYIVVFKDGSAASRSVPASANAYAGRVGGSVHKSYTRAVRGFAAQLTETAARRLAADSSVAYVEQDRQVRIAGTQTNPVWGLDRVDQRDLPLSRSYTYPNASNVTAYIIDTGMRLTHAEFGTRARSGYDFIDNDADASDCQGHGTHVGGTVGGTTYGVAKDVKLVSVRVLDCNGSGSYSQIIGGVDWVTANAVKPAVANMSLGGAAGSTLDTAVKNSIASGVTYAVAAGNDNTDACTKSPARLAEAITVGATSSTDARASFSNYGTCLDIFAPGVNIMSAGHSADTGTATMQGTSMAAPHVAGAVALYLAGRPTATPLQVRDALVAAATTGKVTGGNAGSPNKLLYTTVTTTPVSPTPTPTPTTPPTTTPTTPPPTTTPTTPPPTTTPTACPTITNGGDVRIADLSTATSSITVNCAGRASTATRVEVHVKHTFRGDLAIDLLAPDGSVYRLKTTSTTDAAANVDATYQINASTELRKGTWKLRVTDRYSGDSGTIDSWKLTL